MPTLLEINVTCNQGSTGKIAEQIGEIMIERGWKVYYAHGARRVNPSKIPTIPFSSIFSEAKHYIKSRFVDGDGLGSKQETMRLIKAIKEITPDIVHIHNIHGYYLNYPILFEYLNFHHIKTVITLHDCWSFTGHCTHFVLSGCEKWKIQCEKCPQRNWSPKQSLCDYSSRNYNLKKKYLTSENITIVGVSDWIASMVKQSFLSNNNVLTIHNGIDLSIFRPFDNAKANKKFKILGVANVWDKDKGLDDILKLRKLLSMSEYEITLVGLSEKQVKRFSNSINGITRTSNQEELAQLYSASDVLINPTYADTYPTVNLEAIACGTPVITYRTGGSPESITDDTGIIVEQGDMNGLVHAIKYLNYNRIDWKRCRDYAIRHFNKNDCFSSYANLFEALTSKA